MSGKSTLLLLLAAGLGLAFIRFVEYPAREKALIPPDHRVLPGLEPARVTSVDVQEASGIHLHAEFTNGAWQLTTPIAYPAASPRITGLLQKLSEWDWRGTIGTEELTNHPDAEVEFGFVPPKFILTIEGNGAPRVLYVGRNSALGDEVYLKMRGGYQIFIADTAPLALLPRETDEWRDRTVMDVAHTPFNRIEVHSLAMDSVLTLDFDPATRLWSMTQPISARANSEKITDLLVRLNSARIQQFTVPGVQRLDTPQLRLDFLRDKTDTNLAFELQAGASPTNQTNAVVARRLSPDDLVEIPRDVVAPWEESYTNFLDFHLTSLSPALITAIHGVGADDFTAIKTTNGTWQVSDGGETFPADRILMDDWLSAFTNLTLSLQQLTVADVTGYGLDAPLLRYQIYYSTTNSSLPLPSVELHFGLGTNGSGTIYERAEGSQSVFALRPDQMGPLRQAGWELRDRSIFHFDSNDVTAIQIHQMGRQSRWVRDASNTWVLVGAKKQDDTPLTTMGINETLFRMGQLQAVFWDAPPNPPLEPFGFAQADDSIDFELNRHGQLATNTIHFGARSPVRHVYAYATPGPQTLVFEFPADFYDYWVSHYLRIPEANPPP